MSDENINVSSPSDHRTIDHPKKYIVPDILKGKDGNYNLPPMLDPFKTPNLFYGNKSSGGKSFKKSEMRHIKKFYEWLGDEVKRFIENDDLKSKIISRLSRYKEKTKECVKVDSGYVDDLIPGKNETDDFDSCDDVVSERDFNESLLFASLEQYMKADVQSKLRIKRIQIITIILEILYPKLEFPYLDIPVKNLRSRNQLKAWNNLSLLSSYLSTKLKSRFPKTLLNCLDFIYRVDMFNNVVSIYASRGSKCACHFDHIFPRVRGGVTNDLNEAQTSNIHLIHATANMRKQDKIIQCLDPAMMKVGYGPEEFARFLLSENGDNGMPLISWTLGISDEKSVKIPGYMMHLKEDVLAKVGLLLKYEQQYLNNKSVQFIRVTVIDSLFPEKLQKLSLEDKLEFIRKLLNEYK